jgi:ornithine cyclodeaminase/alanine dehydrogenase-like protein (mu-crystallin family)
MSLRLRLLPADDTAATMPMDRAVAARGETFADDSEAGDLIPAAARELTRPEKRIEIGEVAEGRIAGCGGEEEITFFKSVGVGAQDVVAAAKALMAAEEQGLGTMIDF